MQRRDGHHGAGAVCECFQVTDITALGQCTNLHMLELGSDPLRNLTVYNDPRGLDSRTREQLPPQAFRRADGRGRQPSGPGKERLDFWERVTLWMRSR